MNELQIVVDTKPGEITFNHQEIKAALMDQMKVYKDLPVTIDNRVERKKDIATLRKIKTAVDDRRKEIKQAWMKPYDAFENQVKELKGLIDEPINLLNDQVKELEEAERKEKREKLKEAFGEMAGDMTEWLDISQIYDSKWENATVSLKAAKAEMEQKISGIIDDLSVLNASTSDAKEHAIEIYMGDLDLAKAMKYINYYEAQAAEIRRKEEERKQREQEAALEAERQRIREEERRRIREEEEIRQKALEEGRQKALEATKEEIRAEVVEEIKKPITDEIVTDAKISAIYVVSAPQDGLNELEMLMDSIGIIWEKREV